MRLDYRWLGTDDLTKRAAAAAAEIAGLRPTAIVAVEQHLAGNAARDVDNSHRVCSSI
jgi:hypothetical protein